MNYIWESGHPRRVMHIQAFTRAGEALWKSLCGKPHKFNRAINAPFSLGQPICKDCLAKTQTEAG